MSMTVSPSFNPPLAAYLPEDSPYQVESLEKIMHELYEIMSAEETRAISNLGFAVETERAWREALSKKLEETQERLSAATSREGTIARISDIIAPLCLSAIGIASCISNGEYVRGGAAIAVGALLAADAALGNKGKQFLAECLHRVSNVDKKTWVDQISLTCTLVVSALTVCLPEESIITVASTISQRVLECTQTGVHWSTKQQEALILEISQSWKVSERNMHSLQGSVELQQESPHDQLRLLTQLQHSNNAAIADFF